MLVQTDLFKEIAKEILNLEKERSYIKEDMEQIKEDMLQYLPKSSISKVIKIRFGKSMTEKDRKEYKRLCNLLGLSFTCAEYVGVNSDLEDNEVVSNIKRLLNSYGNLIEQYNEQVDQIKDVYTQAKNKGISVPLLKKVIDFCLHPDKLKAFNEDSPLLESYMKMIPDIDSN